ncbi:MAG TPA: 6-phosphogluconolactonase [Steroidobacteraceae bacterium]|nr:6-phosphogluconolactonase [Steroidobacteraceae bacterium]
MKFSPQERRFPAAAALMQALAADVASALEEGLAAGRGASLVVAGGKTPAPVFDALSATELDWEDVWVTLTDERWTDTSREGSNEYLLRQHLLRGEAAKANLVGMKNKAADPAAGASAAWSAIAQMPRPFDFVLLGMGDDGHMASLFPHSPGLDLGLDLHQPPGCLGMTAPVEPRPRLSMNLRALVDARRIAVLIVGQSKWDTYQKAKQGGPVQDMPVRALSLQQNVPVTVYWAP